MKTRLMSLAALMLAATAFFAFRPSEETATAEPFSVEALLPAGWAELDLPADALMAAPPCSPRAIIGSDLALKLCLRDAFERGCDLDIDANVLGTCPDGQFNVQLTLIKVCDTLSTPVADVFVCGCDLDTWTCL